MTDRLSYEITSLQPATKYFVTVSAGTSDGFGRKSVELSEMTYGGKRLIMIKFKAPLAAIIESVYQTIVHDTTVVHDCHIWAYSISLTRLRIAGDLWYNTECALSHPFKNPRINNHPTGKKL